MADFGPQTPETGLAVGGQEIDLTLGNFRQECLEMAINFTKREKDLIRHILTIAKKDPSIYVAKTDVAMKRVDAEIEEIERKLHRDN